MNKKEFLIPAILVAITTFIILYARTLSEGWAGLGYVILAVIVFFSAILYLIFIGIKWAFDLEFNWWQNTLAFIAFFIVATQLMRLIALL